MIVLAGPIVRRVEPRLASVWVATDSPCLVTLDIFRDLQTAPSLPTPQFSCGARAVRAGAKIYVALVVADLADPAQPLLPEVIYSYNLTFLPDAGGSQTLQSLGLLTDRSTPKPHLALGYGNNVLPSFVLPPRQLKDLNILHGSCRRVGFDAPDAMTYIDDLLAVNHNDAVRRPQQLFLTGDQIYADNLPTAAQIMVTNLANQYMGCTERVPTHYPRNPGAAGSTPRDCDLINFPAGLRKNLVMHDARLSTSDGNNHLLSFGEFCMMHLLTWSNELWVDTLTTQADAFKALPTTTTPTAIWELHFQLLGDNPPADTTSPAAKDKTLRDLKTFSTENVNKILHYLATDPKQVKAYNREVHATKIFVDGLPRVRRALANIATYMIFDDHEITDDWNFSKIWKDRVMTSPLGSTVLRNGLMAYTLFQGWGNDPNQFTDDVRDPQGNAVPSPQKQLLDLIPQMFPGASGTPPDAVAKKIDSLLGLVGDPPPPNTPLVTWHYRVPGTRHLVLVLDVRTRRTSSGRTAAPENLSAEAVKQQIPTDTDPMLINLPAEIDIVLVISSLVVLGPPIFDSLFGPLAYKIYDIKDHFDQTALPATDPDAIESWPNDEPAFERLLNALAPLKRVVMLSGDVHYASSVVMSYWKDRFKPPARFAQLVCSALKNNFEDKLAWADQAFAIFQKVLQLNDEAARLGWNNFVSDLMSLPAGKKPLPALDARMQQAPILLPTLGWPDGTNEKAANPPDFCWRLHVVRDQRTDSQRPEAQRAASLFSDPTKDVTATADAFQTVAVRHTKQLDKMNFTRQMLFNTNLGAIRFERNADVVTVIHQLYSSHPKALLPDKGEIYMEHRIDLDTPLEHPPFIGTPE
jgi:hypothetical protein